MRTQQTDFWSGDFGREYTDRNTTDLQTWNRQYREKYGITRLDMNVEFLQGLSREARVLEVGCNTGQQLEALRLLGFKNVVGIELQLYAAKYAKNIVHDIPVLQASGFEIPFKTNSFDLVFTSGVLIHIAPDNLPIIMSEMHRCTSKYLWGFEYYSDRMTEINYRGNTSVLWKADYASLLLDEFHDLRLINKVMYPYTCESEIGNVDCMYLVRKIG